MQNIVISIIINLFVTYGSLEGTYVVVSKLDKTRIRIILFEIEIEIINHLHAQQRQAKI